MKKFILSLAALAFAGIAANAQVVSIDFVENSTISKGESVTFGDNSIFTMKVIANEKDIVIENNSPRFFYSGDNGPYEKDSRRMKTGGEVSTTKDKCNINGTVLMEGTLYLYVKSSSSSAARNLSIIDGNDETTKFVVSDANDKKTVQGVESSLEVWACHSVELPEGDYTIISDGGINFHKVVFVVNGSKLPTPVEDIVAENASQVVKTIENGQIIIIKNGVKYNVLGQIVK